MSLERTIGSTNGIASVRSLKSQGFSEGLLRAAVRTGLVFSVRRGWLALPDASPDLVEAVALGGRLGCVSAAAHRGLWTQAETRPLHVAVPRHSGHVSAQHARDVVTHWQSANWATLDSAIEVPAAMAIQLAACLPREQLVATLDSALNGGLLTIAQLEWVFRDASGDLDTLVESLDPLSQSGLESLCRVRLRRLGLRVRSQVFIEGVGHVDLLVGDRLVVEADGREWHESPEAFETDRQRDLRLVLLGYRVIRLSYRQILREWPLVELSILALTSHNDHLWR